MNLKIIENPMLIGRPKWQDEEAARLSEEYGPEVIEANTTFKANLDRLLKIADPVFYGRAVQSAIDMTSSLLTVSNIGPDGAYEANVNLLMASVSFTKMED